MRSKGEDRRGRCPGPVTALLCRSGVDIQSVWQWLSLHRGHLAYVINEPGASGLLGVPSSSGARRGGSIGYRNVGGRQMSGRGRQQSMESLDSILPVYEPPPPSVHSSIPEDIRAEIDAMQTSDNQHQGQQSMEERRRMSIVSTTDESMSSDEDGGLQVLPLTLSLVLDFPTVLPPVYSDIAADTEYGRSYATRLAAVAGNTIFGSASGYVLQNAATILARSIAADLAAQQADQQADHNDSAGAGSIPSMAFLPTESAAEVESDILRDIVQLTRTFTQSMPMLNRLLSDDDAIAAIEESRRRAMATAAIGNNQAALRIAEQAVVDAAMAETLVGDHTRVPQISVGTVAGSGSAAAPSNDSGSGVVVSFEVGSWDTGDARSANSARSTRDSIDSSVLHAINGRVRRSRLSARTNPEYASSGGKKSSWLARLLHM
ncbi:hypothetical protein LPJ66_002424 [Kickxella alabastrina]|uniref:Uncharacterized protein n=1 Tax=Kickxella alabastrina TaxID=61397 RepID=A0ACC1IQK9_9FUNG|nr:hypothetical protein LPJ66_002424 [Kickxella alabastrina]